MNVQNITTAEINDIVFNGKYKLYDKETFVDMCKRVAYNDEQEKFMKCGIFMPAGRQLIGRNNPKNLTLFNCYITGYKHDSLEAINELEGRSDKISSKGGGIGINFSILRPAISKSSGAVSFMKRFANGQAIITQGGSRRGALIGVLTCFHPAFINFINSKQDLKEINNMNISPMLTKEFMTAVKENKDWDLVFPDFEKIRNIKNYNNSNMNGIDYYTKFWNGDIDKWVENGHPIKVYQTIKARKLWNIIVRNAWLTGEPGVLFYDNINDVSNYKDYTKIWTVNPCGEQTLPLGKNGAGSSCNLGSINFKSIYNNKYRFNNNINWDLFEKSIKIGIDYLDKSIDEEKYFDKEIEENQKFFRQIGLGIMGYADLLILLGLKYGSDEALKFTKKLMSFMLDKAYYYSALLAKEKGKAPIYNEIEINDFYLKKCSKETQEMVKKYGLRNSNILSIAPTGSIAMLLNINGGIEPYFKFKYYRNDIFGKRLIEIPIVKDAPNKECLIEASDVTPEQHIRTQAVFQKWVDSSISKTINLPESATEKDISDAFMLAYDLGLKGTTVYRDKSREGVLTTVDDNKNNLKLWNDNFIINIEENKNLYSFFEENNNEVIVNGVIPPKSSYCKKIKIKSGNKKYYFIVGFLSKLFKYPYEFFIISNCREKTNIVDELIEEMSELLDNYDIDEDLIENMQEKLEEHSNVDKVARLISMGLRHNIPIIAIADLLEKYTPNISSLLYSIRKTLLKLMPEGTIIEKEKCPECGSDLIYVNGCVECTDRISCGYSKC